MSYPPSSPSGSIHTNSVSADALAAAAERRRHQPESSQPTAAQLAAEHERRQEFRRLIDPGILRPNAKDAALASLKTLLTISENLLREPDNPKFQQFKPTNNVIKRHLIDPKGTLEYAIELGFRPEVKNFQPYYSFNPRRMADMRIGAAILKEAIDLETEKQERAALSKKEEKAVADAAANKVKLAFMDDRKTKMFRDQREKELREARAAAAARQAELRESSPTVSVPSSPSPTDGMPGSGHILGMNTDDPPSYDDDGSRDN